MAGACVGLRDCATLAGPCRTGTCNATTGACTFAASNEGMSCDGDTEDCIDSACRAGVCSTAPRMECALCGAGDSGVCTGSVCGPPVPELVVDFEDGRLPPQMTTTAGAMWRAEVGMAAAGAQSFRSAPIGDGMSTSLTATVDFLGNPPASYLDFFVRVDTASGDVLELLVDGTVAESWSGTTGWTYVRHPRTSASWLSPGRHTVEWRFRKNASGAAGADAVWVDRIRFVDVASPYGFDAGSLAPLTTSGAGTWTVDGSSVAFGAGAARASGVGDGQTGTLTLNVTLPRAGALSFFHRVDGDAGDGLRVFVDGTQAFVALGTHPYRADSLSIATEGPHRIEFRHTRDASGGSGANALWIDQIAVGTFGCL